MPCSSDPTHPWPSSVSSACGDSDSDYPSLIQPVAAIHGSHMSNVYDFYKPRLSSEYPEVDGPLTQICYPKALEASYDHFRQKEARRLAGGKGGEMKDVTLADFHHIVFHSPYGKLVQKGFARMVRAVLGQFELTMLTSDCCRSSTTITFRTLQHHNSLISPLT